MCRAFHCRQQVEQCSFSHRRHSLDLFLVCLFHFRCLVVTVIIKIHSLNSLHSLFDSNPNQIELCPLPRTYRKWWGTSETNENRNDALWNLPPTRINQQIREKYHTWLHTQLCKDWLVVKVVAYFLTYALRTRFQTQEERRFWILIFKSRLPLYRLRKLTQQNIITVKKKKSPRCEPWNRRRQNLVTTEFFW